MTHDVFISFSFKDQAIADRIVNLLTSKYQISCWICTEKIRAGSYYYDEIADAISVSKAVVFIQTKNSVESKEIPDEVLTAIDEGKTIISFIVEDSELHGQMKLKLTHRQHIDGRKDPLEDRIKELAQELCRILDRPFVDNEKNDSKGESKYSLIPSVVELATDEVFIGRDSLIDDIHAAFDRHNTVFLQGMGGIGKSELAKQYYHKYKKTNTEGYYDAVLFVRYNDSLASLIADDLVFNIKGLSRKTKCVDGKDELQSDEEYARDKIAILKRICDRNTLIIIDNFDINAESEPLFAEFINKAPYRILVTTRNAQENYKTIPVGELDDESLKTIFLKYYGEGGDKIANDENFGLLLDWTARHTLTIELIAKHMKGNFRRMKTIRQMLDSLNDRHLHENLKENSYDRIRKILHISDLTEDDTYFLRCLAMMPAGGINYVDYFEKWIRRDNGSEYYWDDVLDKLTELSIVKDSKDGEKIYLHPIIREVVINELKPSYENCKEFIDVFENFIDENNSWNWSIEKKSIAVACMDSIMIYIPEIDEANFHLLYNFSILKNFVQDYDEVMPLHEKLYQYCLTIYGNRSLECGKVAFRAGWFCKKLLLIDDATKWLEISYQALKEHYDECLIEFPHCCTNLCNLFIKKYEFDNNTTYLATAKRYLAEANNTTETSYEIVSKENNTEAEIVLYQRKAGIKFEQAEILIKEKHFTDAIAVLDEANKILSSNTNNDADMAYLVFKYASVYYYEGNDYLRVLEEIQKAIELYNKVFSGVNDFSMNMYIMLAECYDYLEKTIEAHKAWENALRIAQMAFIDEHPIIQKIKEKITVHS